VDRIKYENLNNKQALEIEGEPDFTFEIDLNTTIEINVEGKRKILVVVITNQIPN
jgi:hypothetical protein